MKTDSELKRNVLAELKWDASIKETEVGVLVTDGIVTLTGDLNTYVEKWAAEKAAKRVLGVKGVVEDIKIKLLDSDKRNDVDIAKAALNKLDWNPSIPKDVILVKVENGWVTLSGSVKWNYQKKSAKKTVQNLRGVRGVTNLISIKSPVESSQVKESIKKTFERNAVLDVETINIKTEGHKVTLEGTVKSWDEKKQAAEAAWSSPGVWDVVDNLKIKSREFFTDFVS